MQIQLSELVQYKADVIVIPLQIILFSPWYSRKIAELVLNNNHSLTQQKCEMRSKVTFLDYLYVILHYVILHNEKKFKK